MAALCCSPSPICLPADSIPSLARFSLLKCGTISNLFRLERRCSLRCHAAPLQNKASLVLGWRNVSRPSKILQVPECGNSGGAFNTRAVKKSESSSKSEESVSFPSERDSVVEILDEVEPPTGMEKRLFSNLNEATLRHEPGSLSGSILLVAGTTVGAGILAIPAATQDSGFLASAATCVACWSFMVVTGLLVAEVNINTMCELGSGGVSLVSMASRTLGKTGVRVTCALYLLYNYTLAVAYVARCSDLISNAVASPLVTYLFIHYALLVAYVARSSEIVSTAIGSPLWLSGCLFTGALGGLCYFCSQQTIDIVNGVLVGGIIVSFTVLVGTAAGGLDTASLLRANFAAAPQSVPIIALSFVYQNVVPVVCTSLEGDLPKIRTSIVLGTAIPLVMFLAWDAVILGNISLDPNGVTQTVLDPLVALQSSNGIIAPLVKGFSLLAVATSYIGFVLGLSDFLADLLRMPSGKSRMSYLPYLLTLLPPLGLALTYPDIFFDALDFAGTYGVLVLFGVIPAAMAWSERYSDRCLTPSVPPLVPGGRLTLVVIIGLAGVVIGSELLGHVSL